MYMLVANEPLAINAWFGTPAALEPMIRVLRAMHLDYCLYPTTDDCVVI